MSRAGLIEVTVTERDLTTGKPRFCRSCPLGLAVARATNSYNYSVDDFGHIRKSSDADNPIAFTPDGQAEADAVSQFLDWVDGPPATRGPMPFAVPVTFAYRRC